MDEIILVDGTKIKTDFFVRAPGRVQFTAYGLTILEAAQIFSDPNKTAVMSVKGENDYFELYRGYTKMAFMITQGDYLKICMEEVQ